MRDLAIRNNDLVVATFGRGFWILDNITPLRQVSGQVAGSDAFLYEPEQAYLLPPQDENGTPQPRDEPLAQNEPNGALIDYYLGKDTGLVSLEIINPAGETIKRFSSDDKPTPIDPNKLEFPAFWVKPAPVLSNARGMHRWLWNLRPEPPPPAPGTTGGGSRRNVAPVLPGTYTVKLTAGGKTYTRSLTVKMDPRAK